MALAKPEDVVVAFSIGTGGSYLRNAIAQALTMCQVVLICGRNTFFNPTMSNLLIYELGSEDTPKVQERQLEIIHQLCSSIKALLL